MSIKVTTGGTLSDVATPADLVNYATSTQLASLAARVSTLEAAAKPPAPAPAPPVSTGVLPARILGAYWFRWSGPLVSDLMRDAPQYNLLYGACAQSAGSGSGAVEWGGVNGGDARFQTDIAAWKASGRVALLTIGGGGDGGITITNSTQVAQLVSSVTAIAKAQGFQGIDWDIETVGATYNTASVVSASKQLKAAFGQQFVISMAPRPFDQTYRDIAVALGSNLDLFGYQFYGYPEAAQHDFQVNYANSRTDEAVGLGIPASKLIIGGMSLDGSGTTSPVATHLDQFTSVRSRYPTLRGSYVWMHASDQQRGYEYARTLGGAMGL